MIPLERMPRRPSLYLFIVILALVVISFSVDRSARPNADRGGAVSFGKQHKSHVEDVRNDTLGFEKVFVVSMPSRTDKRDAVSISAAMTDIRFDWVDGVDGTLVSPKAIPEGWNEKDSSGTLGCWRAHMNAIQRMINEDIQTALIIEDDADWDVFIKSQLVELAHGTRYLQDATHKTTLSPYGDDWDLLWLGHCGTRNREWEDQKYYVQHDDPTAVPQSLWGYPRRQPNLTPPALTGNHTRVVLDVVRGLCTFSYALSLRGAKKLLYHQAMNGGAAPSDRALQRVCNDHFMGFKCFAPYPHLIGTHKAAGYTSKDSDREDKSSKGAFRETAETGQIVFSTRLNLGRLVKGEKTVRSQWPNDTLVEEMELGARLPKGRGVFVTKDQYRPFDRPT